MSRLPSLLDPPVLFADGGAAAQVRAQTLEAYQTAIRLGATGLTGSLRAVDGRPAVGPPRRRLARGTPPLALAELLDLAGDDHAVLLDVIDAGAVLESIAQVRDRPGLEGRLWLAHPDLDTLAGWRDLSAEVRLVHQAQLDRLPTGPEAHAAALRRAGVDALSMHESEWSGGTIALVHRFGRLAVAADAQYDRTLDAAIDAGIDAVRGIHVDRMVDALVRDRRPG
ncbi:MAG: hypothetical protein KDB35_12050 [Acidimicrobiales bacterium]|nr:hypothetical protein [Acidimicrobiales bacterium]MCB1261881.1 hypothetical protein [Acidimicrobiales bacterium]